MAVSRGGVAFWVGCVRSRSRRQSFKIQSWILGQAVHWTHPACPLSSATWALAPPNSLRYQYMRQPMLLHPYQPASQPQRGVFCEEDWEESLSVCVLVRQGESNGLHNLLEVPVLGHNKLAELLAPGDQKGVDFPFTMTTVDGSREDDISISLKRNTVDSVTREHGCFRSLFEAERCPAPFMYGSQFYCFHCPGTEPVPGGRQKTKENFGLDNKPGEMPLLPPSPLFIYSARAFGRNTKGGSEEEEKLSIMYERLRMELPSFFKMRHDYTMYSNDVEFINGLINTKTRGRVWYQFILSLWRLLCFCYYAEAQLEVMKLTKHAEDGTIRARWRIWGLPYHAVLTRFYRKDKSHLYRSFDAFSTFYIGQDGFIHCHKVEKCKFHSNVDAKLKGSSGENESRFSFIHMKVMPAQPPVLPRVTSFLAGALVALGVQEHRPALNLLPFLLSSLRQNQQ